MNYYLAKANPNTFRLQDYLATCPVTGWWRVCKDAKSGDTLFIGLAGKEAGIYAKATIISSPTFISMDPGFFRKPEEARKKWRANINFSQNLIRYPILEQNIMSISELKRVAKWLHIQGVACHLREEEAKALDRLIKAS